MALYKALVTFTGTITKAKGEVFSISDKRCAEALLKAKFIKEVKTPLKKVEGNENK